MRSVVCVILFLCLFVQTSSATYLLCTSKCNQITVPFLEPLNIPQECQDNNTFNDIYDYAAICIIEYRIDYDAKNIYITFKASNDTHIFEEYNRSEFLIQTMWLGFSQTSGQTNITHRKYGCRTQYDCARQFYFNTIEHLITKGQLQIDKIKSTLYRQSSSEKQIALRRCKNSNTTGNTSLVRCRDGLCFVNNINGKKYCTSDNTPTFFSEFESYVPKSITNEVELIEYKCNRHLCNSNEMIEKIKNILRIYTNWNNINNEENQIEQKSSITCKTVSNILIIVSLINLPFLL
ncbi:unnamed protein product [Rotaria sp. Silwood1]|nr:unnamed protein product [Rotaria sp. Silwood1]CAF3383632.1 unnamed protein product [Rotaria sp. Silwood1]CAF3412031.1 unnamed protein product [Rotaria sp. Silwood1]CAF4532391.1 unnamed protein product [Rotaria sp. Silwood1]CAF4878121.1 unnamed protein product [Rotaria sp. Silwood1]